MVSEPCSSPDLVGAYLHGFRRPRRLRDLDWDTRTLVLTLARIWSGLATGAIHSKDGAAEWALPRLPEDHRQVLARARAIYLGEEDERWDDIRPQVRAYAERVVTEIGRIVPRA